MIQTDDMPFKLATGLLIALFTATHGYYVLVRRGAGRVIVRHPWRERILVGLVMLAWLPISLYVFSSWLDPHHLPLPDWLRWGGGGIFLLGDLGFWWAHHALGRHWSPILEIRAEHRLVTGGPYRYVRHPMYASLFLVGIGLALLSANWIVAAAFLAPVALLYLARVRAEEEMMLQQFGDAYRAYMARTGRLLPRWR